MKKGEISMNKEEIEELKDFTIDITDIDELALGLEVCSKKSNMVIQEFVDTIIQLQKENKQLKEEKQNVINYIVRELVEINKHQYAKGSRRLKKILELLDDSNE